MYHVQGLIKMEGGGGGRVGMCSNYITAAVAFFLVSMDHINFTVIRESKNSKAFRRSVVPP